MAERKTPDNLFQRLTKLFRSGPSIKRKVKNYSKADKSASSAVELFKKSHSDVYNSTLSAYGTFDRMARYSDFSEMESTPEIASALDIYAEETCSADAEGKTLHIHSDNRKIKELLETLFYDTLNINFNMVMWTRNLCKYGDFFLFNDISPEFGVINAYPIPITEIEREEGYDKDDPSAVRFRWITQGNTILENWQISHFRMLGNDAFLPYGSSVLEAARRIWRQLILIEDAMMVYRVIRAPERRVFYIDVGNVPPEDVATYVEQAKNSLKTNKVVGNASGNVDLRYNPMAVDEDYFIPVRGGDSGTRIDSLAGGQNTSAIEDVEYVQKKLFAALKIPKAYLGYDEDVGCLLGSVLVDLVDGRQLTMVQLVEEYEAGKINYCYSYTNKGEPKIGKISKAWKTKEISEYYEIVLDNGKVIPCTDNHPFQLKNGEYVRADELEKGMSLMAKYSKKSKGSIKGYEQLYNHNTEEWEYTHRIAKHQEIINIHESADTEDWNVVHHVDFDKTNNCPDNLLLMGRKSHISYHAKNGKILQLKSSRDSLRETMKTEEYKQVHSRGVQKVWDNDDGSRSQAISENNIKYNKMYLMQNKLAEMRDNGFVTAKTYERPEFSMIIKSMKRGNYTLGKICKDIRFGPILTTAVVEANCGSWDNFVDQYDSQFSRKGRRVRNYSISNAIELVAQCKTRREFHKKNLVSRTAHENALKNQGIKPADWYKEHIGTFNHKVLEIRKTVVENLVPVFDIQVDKWSNFVVEGSVVVHNSKATLAQEDIRFSRSIARIQKTIIAELNKLAMIHLYAHGFDGEDILDFSLALSNPSSLAQQQKLSLIEQKFTIAGSAPEGMVSKTWIYQNIFGFNRDIIEQIHTDLIREKLEAAEVESAGAEEGGDDEGGGDDGGGLFAGDVIAGPILDGDNDNIIVPQLGEVDEVEIPFDDDSEEDDEEEFIDLDKISADIEGITPAGTVKGVFGNDIMQKRDRSVKHGAAELHMPSFKNMLSNSRPQDTMNDPYDSSWIRNWGKRSQLETKQQKLADTIASMNDIQELEVKTLRPHLTHNTQKMLEKMNSKLGIRRLMTETNNYEQLIEESFDLGFEIDDDGEDDND